MFSFIMLYCNSPIQYEQNVSVVDEVLNILTNTFILSVHKQAIEHIKTNKYPDGFHSTICQV